MYQLLVNVVLPSFISSIGWGLSPYFDKRALEYIDHNTLFIYRNIIIGLLTLSMILIFYNYFTSPNLAIRK